MSESPENKVAWRTAYDYYIDCLTTIVGTGLQPLEVYKARMKKIQEHTDDELTVCLMMGVYNYFELKERREANARPEED